ncbi:hypothetical protein [Microbacterium rhizophilus]|uniref:hypothetical protein n=1 Tax=Microbacterium rhizophilus TaxID=3138934 RepID=UPI0031F090FB
MPETPNRAYPYPTLDGPGNVPLDMQKLAEKVDLDVKTLVEGMTEIDEELAQATSNATPGALVRRDASGRTIAPAPTAAGHTTPKSYVDAQRDAAVASAVGSIFRARASAAAVPANTPTTVTVTFPPGYSSPPATVAIAMRAGVTSYEFPCHLSENGTTSATAVVRHNNPGGNLSITVNFIAVAF